MTLDQLLERLWTDYAAMNPQVKAIHKLFKSQGENIQNDHIALRTFDHPKVNIATLAKAFIERGYQQKGEYHFEEKKLYAQHFEHPESHYPKIFISELLTKKLSEQAQGIINSLVEQVSDDILLKDDLSASGRPWNVSYKDFQTLAKESEYAAWMSAWGFRVNHFTVLINELEKFESVADVNTFLKENDYKLNTSGGEIKGTPEVYLEQSSTLADQVEVEFSDGNYVVPACYYEFAKRYALANGGLYTGFVASSADKIFESTNQ